MDSNSALNIDTFQNYSKKQMTKVVKNNWTYVVCTGQKGWLGPVVTPLLNYMKLSPLPSLRSRGAVSFLWVHPGCSRGHSVRPLGHCAHYLSSLCLPELLLWVWACKQWDYRNYPVPENRNEPVNYYTGHLGVVGVLQSLLHPHTLKYFTVLNFITVPFICLS